MSKSLQTTLFYFSLVGLLIFCFFYLQPRVAVGWSNQKQLRLLEQFSNEIQQNQSLNLKSYWYFREFYSPGIFYFNPEVVTIEETFRLGDSNEFYTDIFTFESEYISSTDTIVATQSAVWEKHKFATIKENIDDPNIILSQPDTLIYYSQPNKIELWFVRPTQTMQEIVGFFDYTDKEKHRLRNKLWLHHAIIETPEGRI